MLYLLYIDMGVRPRMGSGKKADASVADTVLSEAELNSTSLKEQPQADTLAVGSKPDADKNLKAKTWYRKHHMLVPFMLIILLVSALGVGSYIYLGHHQGKHLTSVSSRSVVQSTTLNSGKEVPHAVKTLGDLHFFKTTTDVFGTNCAEGQSDNCPALVSPADLVYLQIDETSSGKPIILVKTPAVFGPSGKDIEGLLAVEDSPSHYIIYIKYSSPYSSASDNVSYVEGEFEKDTNSNVGTSADTALSQFNFPGTVYLSGRTFKLPSDLSIYPGYVVNNLSGIRGSYFGGDIPLSQVDKLGQYGSITFYEVLAQDKSNFQVKEIYGVAEGVMVARYQVYDSMITSVAPSIKWSVSSASSKTTPPTTYYSGGQGCGSAFGYVVAKNVDQGQLTQVGTNPDNKPIYEIAINSALFQDIYKNDYSMGSYLDDKTLENLTAEEFQNAHGILIVQNATGEYVVYLRSDMYMRSQCGKPVIYLYPAQTTNVSVRVGARITKSSPTYPVGGWQSVMAESNGTLHYLGHVYPYLFWEGVGLGPYPSVSTGTIVPIQQAAATIRVQLAEQGLEAKEIDDFMSYWQPRIPDSPYVRLSWLSVNDINQLAPLDISPKPTTLIRVFLDMKGLQKPYAISPQKFSIPVRKGFTVVEWGGLL